MPNDVKWELNIDTTALKEQVRAAIVDGTTEVFELDIKPEAVKLSPYLTGTNRRSIDSDVLETTEGVQATLYTQSGYGGYLETGTSKMAAQPYLFPAFNKFIDRLKQVISDKIKEIK